MTSLADERDAVRAELEVARAPGERTARLDSGEASSVHLEYLKNTVLGFVRATEPSAHRRLLPVLAQILSLTPDKRASAAAAIEARASGGQVASDVAAGVVQGLNTVWQNGSVVPGYAPS